MDSTSKSRRSSVIDKINLNVLYSSHYDRIHRASRASTTVYDPVSPPPHTTQVAQTRRRRESSLLDQKRREENLHLVERLESIFGYSAKRDSKPLTYRSTLQLQPGIHMDGKSYPRIDCVNPSLDAAMAVHDRARRQVKLREIQDLMDRNTHMMRRLSSAKSAYNRTKMEREFERNRQLVRNASRIKAPHVVEDTRRKHTDHFRYMREQALRNESTPTARVWGGTGSMSSRGGMGGFMSAPGTATMAETLLSSSMPHNRSLSRNRNASPPPPWDTTTRIETPSPKRRMQTTDTNKSAFDLGSIPFVPPSPPPTITGPLSIQAPRPVPGINPKRLNATRELTTQPEVYQGHKFKSLNHDFYRFDPDSLASQPRIRKPMTEPPKEQDAPERIFRLTRRVSVMAAEEEERGRRSINAQAEDEMRVEEVVKTKLPPPAPISSEAARRPSSSSVRPISRRQQEVVVPMAGPNDAELSLLTGVKIAMPRDAADEEEEHEEEKAFNAPSTPPSEHEEMDSSESADAEDKGDVLEGEMVVEEGADGGTAEVMRFDDDPSPDEQEKEEEEEAPPPPPPPPPVPVTREDVETALGFSPVSSPPPTPDNPPAPEDDLDAEISRQRSAYRAYVRRYCTFLHDVARSRSEGALVDDATIRDNRAAFDAYSQQCSNYIEQLVTYRQVTLRVQSEQRAVAENVARISEEKGKEMAEYQSAVESFNHTVEGCNALAKFLEREASALGELREMAMREQEHMGEYSTRYDDYNQRMQDLEKMQRRVQRQQERVTIMGKAIKNGTFADRAWEVVDLNDTPPDSASDEEEEKEDLTRDAAAMNAEEEMAARQAALDEEYGAYLAAVEEHNAKIAEYNQYAASVDAEAEALEALRVKALKNPKLAREYKTRHKAYLAEYEKYEEMREAMNEYSRQMEEMKRTFQGKKQSGKRGQGSMRKQKSLESGVAVESSSVVTVGTEGTGGEAWGGEGSNAEMLVLSDEAAPANADIFVPNHDDDEQDGQGGNDAPGGEFDSDMDEYQAKMFEFQAYTTALQEETAILEHLRAQAVETSDPALAAEYTARFERYQAELLRYEVAREAMSAYMMRMEAIAEGEEGEEEEGEGEDRQLRQEEVKQETETIAAEEEAKRLEEEENARLEAERAAKEEEERKKVEEEEAARLEAERIAAAQEEERNRHADEVRAEAERVAAEEAKRRDDEARIEAERIAAEEEAKRLEVEENARLEAERVAAEEAQRRDDEARLEAERIAAEEEAKRLEVEENARLEAERIAAEEEAQRRDDEARVETERIAAEEEERERREEEERLARDEEERRKEKVADDFGPRRSSMASIGSSAGGDATNGGGVDDADVAPTLPSITPEERSTFDAAIKEYNDKVAEFESYANALEAEAKNLEAIRELAVQDGSLVEQYTARLANYQAEINGQYETTRVAMEQYAEQMHAAANHYAARGGDISNLAPLASSTTPPPATPLTLLTQDASMDPMQLSKLVAEYNEKLHEFNVYAAALETESRNLDELRAEAQSKNDASLAKAFMERFNTYQAELSNYEETKKSMEVYTKQMTTMVKQAVRANLLPSDVRLSTERSEDLLFSS